MNNEGFEGYITISKEEFPSYQKRVEKYCEYLRKKVEEFSKFYWEDLVEEAKSKYRGIKKLFITEIDYINKYQKENEYRYLYGHGRSVYRDEVKEWRQAQVFIRCLEDVSINSIQIPLWFHNNLKWFEKREEEK